MQFLDMMIHVDKALGTVISDYGTYVYVVLFGIIFCETGLVVMPFLPGDSLLFIAGAFCATGAMNVSYLIVLLIVAAILGDSLNYWVGKIIGQKVFTQNYAWIDRDALNKTHMFFEKHGGKTVTIARFVPIVRTFAPFLAGVSGMSVVQFQLYNAVGGVVWIVSLVVGGYFFGNIPIIREHLNLIVILAVIAAVIPIIFVGFWRLYVKLKAKKA